MNLEARLESLRAKHAQLETAIEQENHRPAPDNGILTELKRQKLKLKEEMERLHV